MLTSKAVVQMDKPEGAVLLNLPKFPGGCSTAVSRIPDCRGVYAFFPFVSYPDDPEELFKVLVSDVERKKFADRRAFMAPYYGLTLQSQTTLSRGKLQKLREALRDDRYRHDLIDILGNSILFQSPLYLGKSKNLRSRVNQHLDSSSPLRQRLADAGYEIERTSVLVIPSLSSEGDELLDDDSIDSDGLAEEILSRLFQIQFTLRLG